MVAIGRARFVKGDWIKPGAVVIDCGINSITGKFHLIMSNSWHAITSLIDLSFILFAFPK